MKTTTMLAIGGGAALLLYLKGKSALTSQCASELQQLQQTGVSVPLALPGGATVTVTSSLSTDELAKQCAALVDAKMTIVGSIRAGAVSFWRPLTPADIQ